MSPPITALILTFNEAPNIGRTLARLPFVNDIVVVDSGSTDDTRAILSGDSRVRVVERPFTSFGDQWQFALTETGIATDWVLALDADYVLSDQLVEELTAFSPAAGIDGYWASFDYCINGQRLRGGAYPPVAVLYRRSKVHYVDDGHNQRVQVDGSLGWLAGRILHDDRKSLSTWLAAQGRYMRLEADKLLGMPASALAWIDRARLALVIMPLAIFFYSYVWRGGVLDGRAGLYYALQRAAAELLLSLHLCERRLQQHDRPKEP